MLKIYPINYCYNKDLVFVFSSSCILFSPLSPNLFFLSYSLSVFSTCQIFLYFSLWFSDFNYCFRRHDTYMFYALQPLVCILYLLIKSQKRPLQLRSLFQTEFPLIMGKQKGKIIFRLVHYTDSHNLDKLIIILSHVTGIFCIIGS